MKKIIEALQEIKGTNVNIYTEHKLFGKQHIKMQFEPETEIGLGFHCRDQVVYIDHEDVVDYCIEDKSIIINGKMMKITIIKRV